MVEYIPQPYAPYVLAEAESAGFTAISTDGDLVRFSLTKQIRFNKSVQAVIVISPCQLIQARLTSIYKPVQ